MSMPQDDYSHEHAMKAATEARYTETVAVEPRPVIEALSSVDSIIERLHHQIGRLTDRLLPITQPEQPRDSPTPSMAMVDRPKSEILHRIETQGRTVDEAADRIANLLALLDL